VSANFERVIAHANQTLRPVPEVLRHYFLEAVLRRLSQSQHAAAFALRGSMITRHWAQPLLRVANDLDFLATFPHTGDVNDVTARFFPPLSENANDDVEFDLSRCRGKRIWETSAFPGVRLTVRAQLFGESFHTTIDVGFNDPLVPAAEVVSYATIAGDACPVFAVHPATMIAWKLHGLVEWGRVRWRAKDFADLWLITTRFPQLSPRTLADAIRPAFESRGYSVRDASTILNHEDWDSANADTRWRDYHQTQPEPALPESLVAVRDCVRAHLQPALEILANDILPSA
jgi:hypothetical protein